MKEFFKKLAKIKKRQLAKKIIGLGSVAWSLNFGEINSNPDHYSPTLVDSRQENHSNTQKIETVQDDGQSVMKTRSNNCVRVQTGSGVLLALSIDIPTETAAYLQETVMVNSNSSSPTVPGGVHGLSSHVNTPRPGNPGRPIKTPQFRTPHGMAGNRPVTGARPEQTKLGASKARENSRPKESTKRKNSPKPSGSTPTEVDEATCSARSDNQEQQLEPGFVNKKKKKNPNQCQHRILRSRIKEDPGLVRAAKKACKNQAVQADINHLEEQLAQGNMNPGMESTALGNGFMEHRGRNGGRIITKEVDGGVIEIYGKSGKKRPNQQFVIDQVLKVFG